MIKHPHVETAEEEHARYLRVLAADVAWWRLNAKQSVSEALRTRALELAAALEQLLDSWKRHGQG